MATIDITVSATTEKPWPPTLTDPIHSSNTEPGDIAFTTAVKAGDKVQFLTGGAVTGIACISETEGNIFSKDPTFANGWSGVVKGGAPGTIATYRIIYEVNNDKNRPYSQDPKIEVH